MQSLSTYMICVGCAAMACAICNTLPFSSGSVRAICKTVTGLLLTFSVLQPLGQMDLQFQFPDFRADAAAVVAEGEQERAEALRQVIKEKTEAYILDKATAMGADLCVSITVSNDPLPVPVAADLSGHISPYARKQLENLLINELRIPKEDQLWT